LEITNGFLMYFLDGGILFGLVFLLDL